jgi:hypothetical protein
VLTVALLALLVFVALYVLRSLDDNRLTSWAWVFNVVSAPKIYLALAGGIVVAWLALRLPEPGQAALGVLSFAAASVFWREPEAIVDASRYFTQAKHLSTYGASYFLREWGVSIEAWTDLPAVPFIYGIGFKVFGESRAVVQAINSAMFSASVVMTVRLGGALWNREVGLTAGAFLMAMPYLYTQVPLMLVDVPSMFFLLLALLSFVSAVRNGGLARSGISALALFLALFSKFSLWLMLTVLLVAWTVLIVTDGSKAFKRGLAVFAVGVALACVPAVYKFDVISEQVRLLIEYQRPGLQRWTESFTSTFLFQIHPFVTAAALYSVWRAVRERDLKYAVVLWLPALMLFMEIKRIRYLVPVFPMVALMAGYGLAQLRSMELRRFAVSSAVISSFIIAVFGYLPFISSLSISNLMDAGRFINSVEASRVRVVTMDMKSQVNPAVAVPLMDIYTEKQIVYEYKGHTPPESLDVDKSPLRFTWRYENPAYYRANSPEKDEILAIVSTERPKTPEGYEITRVFDINDGIFRFRTFVTLYRQKAGSL